MNEKLSLQQIVELLTDKTGVGAEEINRFLDELVTIVNEGIVKDQIVKIRGIGVFKITLVKDRESMNVHTKERFIIPGHHKLSFLPQMSLKELVNKQFSAFEAVEIKEDGESSLITDIRFASDDEDDEDNEDKGLLKIDEKQLPVNSEESKIEEEIMGKEEIIETEEGIEKRYSMPPIPLTVRKDKEETQLISEITEITGEKQILFLGDNAEEITQLISEISNKTDEQTQLIGEIPDRIDEEQTQLIGEIPERIDEEQTQLIGEIPDRIDEEQTQLIGEIPDRIDEEQTQLIGEIPERIDEEQTQLIGETPERIDEEQTQLIGEIPDRIDEEQTQLIGEIPERIDEEQTQLIGEIPERIDEEQTQLIGETPDRIDEEQTQLIGETEEEQIQPIESYQKRTKKSSGTTYSLIAALIILILIAGAGIWYLLSGSSGLFNQDQNKWTPASSFTLPGDSITLEQARYNTKIEADAAESGTTVDSLPDSTTVTPVTTAEPPVGQTKKLPPSSTKKAADSQTKKPASSKKSTNESTKTTPPSFDKVLAKVSMDPGSRLTLLALKYYGNKIFWVYIYDFNKTKIGSNPDHIPTGMEILIPAKQVYGIDANNAASCEKARQLQAKLKEGN
jgi:nucleoid DNA-binding protein/nucleoid-associated protein YgaU